MGKFLKKSLVIMLSLIFMLTVLFQTPIPAFGAVETKTKVVEFGEDITSQRQRTITLPNLFKISDISVDTGVVTSNVNGDSVTVSVYGGEVSSQKRYTFIVTTYVDKLVDDFSEKTSYSDKNGFTGELDKVGNSTYNNEFYEQEYRGVVTNEKCNFYKYTVTINYTENVNPDVKVNKPVPGKSANNEMKLDYSVKDENVGDSVSVFYSIYGNNVKVQNVPLGEPVNTDGSEQKFSDKIDLSQYKLTEGENQLYIWAVDKKGAESVPVLIPFVLDLTPPAAPEISQNPGNDVPTKNDVQITIKFPDDAVTKKYKEGPDGELKDYKEPFNISVNEAVYSVCEDEAGNVSTETVINVNNIDKTNPTAPLIKTSADETVSTPINVDIVPGEDKESGIERTEYSLTGATVSDWKKYDGTFSIKNEGKTEIHARSIDKAGNTSNTTTKTVEIKPATVASPVVVNPIVSYVPVSNNVPSATPANSKAATEPAQQKPGVAVTADLAVYLTADKTIYGENETLTFTIDYRNKLKTIAEGTVVKADIPQYTSILDGAGGTVTGSSIEWKVGNLAGEASGEIKYTVKAGLLDKAEVNSTNKAVISCSNTIENKDDDESTYLFMLYSNRFDNNNHKKFIVGYKGNLFKPENSITRAEVAAILIRVLNLGEGTPDKVTYNDFTNKHWAYGYIYSATKYGLFEGYKDGSFKPDSQITRAELSTALARYLKLKNIEPQKVHFTDIIGHWAENYIEEIYRIKLIQGYQDGKFMPDSAIKRSETVTIIDRMLFRGPLKGADVSFTDIKKDYWAYGHIVESSLDHYYTRNTDGSETKVNKEN